MVLETPFFIIVSVPVGGLNFMVVPVVTEPVPKAVDPKRELPAVWPNRPVL